MPTSTISTPTELSRKTNNNTTFYHTQPARSSDNSVSTKQRQPLRTIKALDSDPGLATMSAERKNWDKAEWADKARQKDAEGREFAKAKEKAQREGKKFIPRDEPTPTSTAQSRTSLNLTANLGKTTLAQLSSTRGPGFYCELCNRTFKDSLSYVDHLNSRFHLSKLGQSTHVARSTLAQVREKIRVLREQSQAKVDAKNYDFEKRIKEVKAEEEARRQKRREERRRKREERRRAYEEEMGIRPKSKPVGGDGQGDVEMGEGGDDIQAMMGFAGFGSSKR